MADVQASWLAVARRELQEWPLFGGRGDIKSAIDDYSQLLRRNKSCEENVSRLESVNIKLRKEKVDLVKEISTVKQEAHQDILRAEAALKEKIQSLESQVKELTDQLESTQQTLEDTTNELSAAKEDIKQANTTIEQLEERNEQLHHDLEDMKEALSGETDARVAATSELEARLVAKERAESDKDKAEAQFRELKQNYLSKVDSLAKAQDAANEEFTKYKEMQRLLELDRAAWDEQHKTIGRRSSNPAASFTLGSVFGGVANAIRGVGANVHGASGSGQGEQQDEALAAEVAAAKQQAQQEEALEVPLLPEEEVVWPDVSPQPAAVLQRHEKVHGGGCNSITFSPSGLYAATCGQDGVVRLWSTQDGTLSTELKPSNAQTAASINAVAFAEDKNMVLGASNDKSIKTWDMHTGRPRFTMTGHTKAVLGIKQHPSLMNMTVSCGEDRLIKVWSLGEGICQRSILCKSKPLDVAFTRDGQCIVSAHYDGSLRVFDASTGSDMRVVDPVHRKEIGPCVAVAPTGHPSRVVSVGRDNAVCVTDIQQGEVVHRFSSTLLSVGTQRCTPAVAPDDSVVCVGSSSGMVLLLNMETGSVEARLSCHSSAVTSVAWNGHSEFSSVVAGSVDKLGDVIFWRAKE